MTCTINVSHAVEINPAGLTDSNYSSSCHRMELRSDWLTGWREYDAKISRRREAKPFLPGTSNNASRRYRNLERYLINQLLLDDFISNY